MRTKSLLSNESKINGRSSNFNDAFKGKLCCEAALFTLEHVSFSLYFSTLTFCFPNKAILLYLKTKMN